MDGKLFNKITSASFQPSIALINDNCISVEIRILTLVLFRVNLTLISGNLVMLSAPIYATVGSQKVGKDFHSDFLTRLALIKLDRRCIKVYGGYA